MSAIANPNVYHRPKQNIPESKKTENWAKNNVDWIISNMPSRFNNTKDAEYYNMYNGNRDDSQWEHITKTYGIEFPAGKLKHIPLVRPLINELHGEATQRELNFTVLSSDNDSVNSKLEQISNNMLKDILQMVIDGDDVDSTLGNIEKYYRQDFKTELEIAANHVLQDFILNNKLKNLFNENLLDKFITGRSYYMVEVNRIGEDPVYKPIKAGEIFYSNNNTKWVKDCDWAVHPTSMSVVEILDKWGEKIKEDDRQKLESWNDMYVKDVYKLDSPWDADRLLETPEDFDRVFWNSDVTNKTSVYYVQWKSIREINVLESPNKYNPDVPFIKILDTEDAIESVMRTSRRKFVKKRYIQDLWHGIRIGDDIHISLGKVKYPIRSMRQPSKVQLSFNGLTFNNLIRPYSLMKITEDIQNLYDIMHWHKENLIALAGVKGSFMDVNAIPDFGTGKFEENLKMWFYYKKLGAAFLDRNKKGADKSFNQYQQYDDTLGAGLDAILGTITHLEDLAGRIIGVNRQRLGAVTQRDGKGVTDQAIFQSSLVTEPIFNEHDEFIQEALTDILQACRVAYKNGYTSSYLSDQYEQRIFTLTPDFALSDQNIYVASASKDKRSIEEIKAFVYQFVGQGMAELDDIFPLFRKSSLKDIEETISANMARRKAEIQAQQQEIQQLQMQLEQAKGQAELEKTKAEIQKLMSEAQENIEKLKIEQETLNLEERYKMGSLELDSKRVDLEAKQLDMSSGNAKEVRND